MPPAPPPTVDPHLASDLVGPLLAVGIVLALVILLDMGLLLAWLLREDDVRAGRKAPLFAPRWSLVHVWFSAQVVVGLVMLLSLASIVATAAPNLARGGSASGSPMPAWLVALLIIVQGAILFLVPLYVVRRIYKLPATELGLRAPSARGLLLAVVAGLGILLLGHVAETGAEAVLGSLLGNETMIGLKRATESFSPQAILAPDEVRGSPLVLLLVIVGIGIVTPIGEEMFFRGWLQRCARQRFGPAWGVALSAVLFALVHGGPLLVLAIVPMGVALALAYEVTGSIWTPILMHAVNNTAAVAGIYLLGIS
jgi:membrane protease YdiL (CAAX protease family)